MYRDELKVEWKKYKMVTALMSECVHIYDFGATWMRKKFTSK